MVECEYRIDNTTCARTGMDCIYNPWFPEQKHSHPAYRCGYYLLPDYRIEQIKSLAPGTPVLFNYRTSGGGLYHGDIIRTSPGVIKDIVDQQVIIESKALIVKLQYSLYWLGKSFFLDKDKAEREREQLEQQEYEKQRIEAEGGTEQ